MSDKLNELALKVAALDQALAVVDVMFNLTKPYLSDKEIPLEPRWDLYKILAKFMPNEGCGDGHLSVLDIDVSPYDDFYIDRYQTISYVNLYDRIKDKEKYTQESIDLWREAVLESGKCSFTYDW